MSAEIEVETVPGLPEDLPPGERVLWQGRPSWRALARQTFSLRWLSGYFAVFIAARAVVAFSERPPVAATLDVLSAVALAGLCLALFTLMAWIHARCTIYTITTRRVVMRIGVALPMTWNLPFKRLASADVDVRSPSDGDIVLALTPPDRIAWLHLWPHVAPWKISRAKPALRAINEPARVAGILSEAVRAWAAENAAAVQIGAAVETAAGQRGEAGELGKPGKPFTPDLVAAEVGQ